jgi:hypothetical protein
MMSKSLNKTLFWFNLKAADLPDSQSLGKSTKKLGIF